MCTRKHLRLGLLILACLFVYSTAADAQDRPKGELFVGFSGRTNGDPVLKGWNVSGAVHVNRQMEIVADFSGHYGSIPSPGSITFANLTSFLLGNPSPSIPPSYNNPFHVYSFLAGPQFSHRVNGRAKIFIRALFGASDAHARNTISGPSYSFVPGPPIPAPGQTAPTPIGSVVSCIPTFASVGATPAIKPYLVILPSGGRCQSDTQTAFSFGAGGGLDVTVAKHWAVRALQADYLNKPDVLGQGSNDFRLSSGLIYQW